jgi:hypothetical protein
MKTLVLLSLFFPILSLAGESLPSRAKRMKALEEAGLFSFVQAQQMDELDQDLLYMRARRSSAEELKALYPSLPLEGLRAFSKEAQ